MHKNIAATLDRTEDLSMYAFAYVTGLQSNALPIEL